MPNEAPAAMRIDKWLWAARFYKTRSLATQAVDNGRVQVDGVRVKPAREVRPGDRLEIRLGDAVWTLEVRALSMQRGPAPVAQALYVEAPESLARRRQQADARRAEARPEATIKGRPTKRDRRRIHRLTDP